MERISVDVWRESAIAHWFRWALVCYRTFLAISFQFLLERPNPVDGKVNKSFHGLAL